MSRWRLLCWEQSSSLWVQCLCSSWEALSCICVPDVFLNEFLIEILCLLYKFYDNMRLHLYPCMWCKMFDWMTLLDLLKNSFVQLVCYKLWAEYHWQLFMDTWKFQICETEFILLCLMIGLWIKERLEKGMKCTYIWWDKTFGGKILKKFVL